MKTTWNDIEVLVVGAGTMGASLAQNYAQNGFCVGLLDVSDEILNRGFSIIEQELNGAKGRIFSPAEVAAIRERIIGTTDYNVACKSKSLNLVVEAATERLDIKKEIFKCLDSLTAPHVVLATNSSSLDSNVLAKVTKRPDKVVWMHYFYLPHKNRAAEYAGTDTASEQSKNVARKYLKLGGKIATHVMGSRKGGVADIIFVALLLEATRMLEEGYAIADIEAAGKKAYNIPIGFLELMDATGLAIGLFSMYSFSDGSNPNDPLFKVYGNFFKPRQNYINLVELSNKSQDKSAVRWIRDGALQSHQPDAKVVNALSDRFLAIGILSSTECVDAGLITKEDLDLLTQNAFLWRKGPFQIMSELGGKRIEEIINKRTGIAEKQRQDFPVSALLKKMMKEKKFPAPAIRSVYTESEREGAVRRIVLSNPRASNAMNNDVFEALNRQFSEANNDKRCKVIIFDTAPIKSFIAGADVRLFIERVKAKNFTAIKDDTAEWQRVIFKVMTGTTKPKIAIVDGQAFGGGVEVATAFALDPHSIVLITNRTSFALPETRLGIYPGLRGTLNLAQLIYNHTHDLETAAGLARYFILGGGLATSSPQMIYNLGCADAIIPQHRRDEIAGLIAKAIIDNSGKILTATQLNNLKFERLNTALSFVEKTQTQIVRDLFNQSDLVPTLYAQGRSHLPVQYTGEMKTFADRAVRRVAANSPNAVMLSNFLISRGLEGFMNGIDNHTLAEFELEHHLQQVFEHPDALIGLEAMVNGKFPDFKRKYPL
ncbi:MAG: 3-hydroxyacyl-CoA dehydrogenase/enoyl-CoA hydratase family protein [Bacteroidota bacterium]